MNFADNSSSDHMLNSQLCGLTLDSNPHLVQLSNILTDYSLILGHDLATFSTRLWYQKVKVLEHFLIVRPERR